MTASHSRAPLLLACGASFLAFLDVTITNLAIPDLARDFGVGVASLSWVVTFYTILFAALLAPAGRLPRLRRRPAPVRPRRLGVHRRVGARRAGAELRPAARRARAPRARRGDAPARLAR